MVGELLGVQRPVSRGLSFDIADFSARAQNVNTNGLFSDF